MINRIFGHSLLYTLANHVPLIANIVVLPLITPFLTKEDYGIYGLTYAYIGAFHAFSMLGIEVLFSNTPICTLSIIDCTSCFCAVIA